MRLSPTSKSNLSLSNAGGSSSSSSSAFDMVKRKIHTLLLLRFNTFGCLVNSLEEQYLYHFNEVLNPRKYGFSSLQEMLDSMTTEVSISVVQGRGSKVVHAEPMNYSRTIETLQKLFPDLQPMPPHLNSQILSQSQHSNSNHISQVPETNVNNANNDSEEEREQTARKKRRSQPTIPDSLAAAAAKTTTTTSQSPAAHQVNNSSDDHQTQSQSQQQNSHGNNERTNNNNTRGRGRGQFRGRKVLRSHGARVSSVDDTNASDDDDGSPSKPDNTNKRSNNKRSRSDESTINTTTTRRKRSTPSTLKIKIAPPKKSTTTKTTTTTTTTLPVDKEGPNVRSESTSKNNNKKRKEDDSSTVVSVPAPVDPKALLQVTIKTEPVSPPPITTATTFILSSRSSQSSTLPTVNNTTTTKTTTATNDSVHVNGTAEAMEVVSDNDAASGTGSAFEMNIVRWSDKLNGKTLKLRKSADSESSSGTLESPDRKPGKLDGNHGNRRQSVRNRQAISLFDASPAPSKKPEPKKFGVTAKDTSSLPEIFKYIEEELKEKRCDKVMLQAWLTIFDMAIENPDTETILKISELFIKCQETFPTKINLLEYEMGALGNIIMNEDHSLRHTVMTSTEVPRELVELLEGRKKLKIEFSVVELLIAFLSDGPEAWTLDDPSHDTVCSKVWETIEKWDINTYLIINEFHYNSLTSNVGFLQSKTPVVQLWACWTLANFLITRPEVYYRMLKSANGEKELETILSTSKDPTILNYAQMGIDAIKQWVGQTD